LLKNLFTRILPCRQKITSTDKLAKLSIEPVVFKLWLATLLADIHRYKPSFAPTENKVKFSPVFGEATQAPPFYFFEAENIF